MAENNTNAPLIETSAVGFTYQGSETPALQDVTLSIGAGECVLLCGKSGCGKTTFTRLLNGLAPAFFPGRMLGSCRVGDLLAGTAAIEEYVPLVGSVFQNPKTQYFNVDTTAELAFPCENVGMPSAEIRSRVQDCARRFGLTGLMDRSIFRLSGGEKQRIAFAAASMLGPVGAGRTYQQPGRRSHRTAARYDRRNERGGRHHRTGRAPPGLDHRPGGPLFLL